VRGFKSIIPTSCVVIRSGRRQRVNATGIVVGDVVCISSGARVPADLRLIYTNSLYLETSWISGLADPLEFSHHCVPKNVSPLSAQNIAFNGFALDESRKVNSVIGKLMEITTQEQVKKTRLELEHKRFVTFIIVLAFVLATVTFLLGFIMNHFQHFLTIFINGFLVICVANVPQGLPITLGAALIIVSRRLAKKGLYMKRLDVVETLGTATVLMTDKRGVLTSNDITVTDV
ncbi:unnamed protein product, partial [Anisakis simplex]|uniref:Cation_ATPase_C domain-containing protein n=1 Tax=Anisakis simplex TaxID=6269 RepID=A0A0M3KJJ4_ANISI